MGIVGTAGHDVLQFEVKEDADYAFSLMTLNPENVTVGT